MADPHSPLSEPITADAAHEIQLVSSFILAPLMTKLCGTIADEHESALLGSHGVCGKPFLISLSSA